MHAAHELNGPSFAHAILTTDELIAAFGHASAMSTMYRTRKVGEVEVFYREAGPADGPVVVLLSWVSDRQATCSAT